MGRTNKFPLIETKEPKTEPLSMRITKRAKRNLVLLTTANHDLDGEPATQTAVIESLIAWGARSLKKKTAGRKSA